jgi:hypothetical protein
MLFSLSDLKRRSLRDLEGELCASASSMGDPRSEHDSRFTLLGTNLALPHKTTARTITNSTACLGIYLYLVRNGAKGNYHG